MYLPTVTVLFTRICYLSINTCFLWIFQGFLVVNSLGLLCALLLLFSYLFSLLLLATFYIILLWLRNSKNTLLSSFLILPAHPSLTHLQNFPPSALRRSNRYRKPSWKTSGLFRCFCACRNWRFRNWHRSFALHVGKHVSPAMQSPGVGSPTLKWTLFHYW